MAQNFRESGELLDYVVGTGETITSGQVVVKGGIVGVSLHDGVEGDKVVIKTDGVFELPKATGVVNLGDALHLNEDGDLTTDEDDGGTPATAYPLIGYAWRSAISAATVVEVKLK